MRASNKLKCDRLARKAHLARISRRKKAQKMDGLREENVSLKKEIERLKKENKALQAKQNTISMQMGNDFDEKIREIEDCIYSKPLWMSGLLSSCQNMQHAMNLSDSQTISVHNVINSDICLMNDVIGKCKKYIREIRAGNEQKALFQQQIYDKLQTILTPQQMSKLCEL